MYKLILASKSKVRREILSKYNINCMVEHSNVDEEPVKLSLLKEGATPEIISKNLAELKANKVSQKMNDWLVLGADSVIDLNGELISKPENREQAFNILRKLNGKMHHLISSACISKNGSMIWNYTDKADLTMRKFTDNELKEYLSKITDENLYAYNVYQIEGEGKNLFSKIEGDENTIMGLPVDKIKEYIESLV
jgi:septum formation protein